MINYSGAVLGNRFIIERRVSTLMGVVIDRVYKSFDIPYVLPETQKALDLWFMSDEL